jgi:hypothetical protein
VQRSGIDALRRFTPESILNALVNGKMRIQGTPLSENEPRAIADRMEDLHRWRDTTVRYEQARAIASGDWLVAGSGRHLRSTRAGERCTSRQAMATPAAVDDRRRPKRYADESC